jgi:hypothetical protein
MTADAAPRPRIPVPGPEHPGWEDLRRTVITAIAAQTLAVEEMCRALPAGSRQAEGDRRVEMAGLCAQVLENLGIRVGTIVDNMVLDAAVIAEREARAYRKGRADERAARRCGPHRNHGQLRSVSDG